MNHPVTLICTVDGDNHGNPQTYNFTWTRSNDPSFITTTIGGDFTFIPDHVRYDDTYTCRPKNKAGEGSTADVKLTVNSEKSFSIKYIFIYNSRVIK